MTTIAELGVIVRSQGVQQAARDLDKLGNSASGAQRVVGTFGSTVKSVFAAFTAAGGVYLATRAILDNARAFENLSAKMRLYATSQAGLMQSQMQLFAIAQRTGTTLEGVTDLYVKLSGASEALRGNQSKLLQVVETFNKALVVSGADTAAAEASTRQFAQALASGTLRGDEFVSVMEGAPRVARALADGLNVPIGKLRDLAAQGKLTSDTVVNALLRGGKAIDEEFGRMPLTVDRSVQKIKNSFLELIGQTNQASGATKGLAKAFDNLANSLGDPQTIAAFQATASSLANIAAKALQAVGALREFFAENAKKSTISLENRRTDLETQLFRAQRSSSFAPSNVSIPFLDKLFGTPSGRDAYIADLKKQLSDVDAELDRRSRAAAVAQARYRGLDPKNGLFVPEHPEAVAVSGGGGGGGVRTAAKAMRDYGDAARDAAAALREQQDAEAAMLAKSLDAENVRTQALTQFARLAAELDGPLKVAEFDHIDRMEQIRKLGEAAGVGAAAITAAQSQEEAAYKKTTEALKEQMDAMANPATVQIMDDFRRGFADTLTDIATGAQSAKDAFKDLFDGIAKQITRAIAEQWSQKLFGAQGTQGGGSAGGWFSSLLGALFGSGGGGGFAQGGAWAAPGVQAFAAGGVVSSPTMFPIGLMGEAGPEAIMPLKRGADGKLGVVMQGGRAGTAAFVQHVHVQGMMDSRTPDQLAQTGMRQFTRAMRRNA